MSNTTVRLAAAAALAFLCGSRELSADQDGSSFFADVRRAYGERSDYADVGEIEIIEQIDGIESSDLHFFETASTRGAGWVWRIMMASDRGFEDRTVWRTADSVMIYDAGLRQAKPTSSIAEAIRDILGEPAAEALLVPTLLESDTGSPALDALVADASVTEPEPCFDNRRCRRLSAPLSGSATIELLVDVESLWVHDVAVVASSVAGTTTIRVRHSESSLGDGAAGTRAAFSPPASTREVGDWEDTGSRESDSSDPAQGFFEVITVDLFRAMVRIVDNWGRPLPNVQPSDLVATIGGREFPIAAVDWQGPPFDSPAGTEAVPATEPSGQEPDPDLERDGLPDTRAEGRLIVIFLQNDFEPSRVKGQMKLFPSLRRMVDNLGPRDRVAVLSFFAHLKLWQDFTTDKDAVKESLGRAFFPGAKPGAVEPGSHPALLDTFDPETAKSIPDSIEALRYTADTLADIPGEKDIVFLGYGLEGSGSTGPMYRSLQAARATTFVLDTTQADFHTLGAGLRTMARATGGTYDSSYNFAAQALRKIERTITGRYMVTIDRSQMPNLLGRVRIRLRDRPGTVLMTPSGFR